MGSSNTHEPIYIVGRLYFDTSGLAWVQTAYYLDGSPVTSYARDTGAIRMRKLAQAIDDAHRRIEERKREP